MSFWKKKNKPDNFVIFQDNNIVGGDLNYEDVPKYLGAIDQFRAQGASEMADNILNKMLELNHPAAMAKKAEDLLMAGDSEDQKAIELFEKAVSMDDSDALMKFGTWILRGRICPDRIDDAFLMLKKVADRGYPHLIIAAPAYYLKQIALGGDHKACNAKLSEWLQIWNPKAFKLYTKGKLKQQDFLAPVAREAGLVWNGN